MLGFPNMGKEGRFWNPWPPPKPTFFRGAKTFIFAWLEGGSWMLILEFPGVVFQDIYIIYWTCRALVGGGGFKTNLRICFWSMLHWRLYLVLKLTGRYF